MLATALSDSSRCVCLCSLLCVCTLDGLKCRALILSMGNHMYTLLYTCTLAVCHITFIFYFHIVNLDVWERRIRHVVDVALMTITARISGHMTVTSGNVNHPEDEVMGSLVFWSAIRALILVSPEDLEADPSTDIKNTPLGSSKNGFKKKQKKHPSTYIHRATKYCVRPN